MIDSLIQPLLLPGSCLIILCWLVYILNFRYRRGFVHNFSEKNVFITGCDSGFGRLLALKLDQMGLRVYAGCFSESGADQLRESSSPRLTTVIVDITNVESIRRAKQFVEENLPDGQHLWGLVSNAGWLGNVCFDFSSVDDYRQVLEVNFFGAVQLIEAFLPMIKKSRGRVVTTTSILQRGLFGACPYTCSKSALALYCDGLRRFVRRYGIKASTIEPGFHKTTNLIRSDEWIAGLEQQWSNLSKDIKEEFGESYNKEMIDSHNRLFNRVPFHWWNKMDTVVDAMTHALGAQRPKDRYVCGWDALCISLSIPLVPDWLLDLIIQRVVRKDWYNLFK